ncbi:MAG: hypothetical protein ACE5GO_07795, partial [Anaerolineales bacterium]
VYSPQPETKADDLVMLHAFALDTYAAAYSEKVTDFNKPVTVQVTYTDADAKGIDEGELSLYYFNTPLNEWVAIRSTVDVGTNKAVAKLDNFSLLGNLYALMAPLPPAAVVPSTTGNLAGWVGIALVFFAGWLILVWRHQRLRKTTSNI